MRHIQPVTRRPGTPEAAIVESERQHPYGSKIKLRTISDLSMCQGAGLRAKEWLSSMVDELGGPNTISLAKRTILERAAFLRAMAEHLEAERLDGKEIDTSAYASLVGQLHNLLRTVGLERIMRDVTPDLSRYIADHAATNGSVEKDLDGGSSNRGGVVSEAGHHPHDTSYENACTSSDDEQPDEPSKADRHAAMDEFYRKTHPPQTINGTAHRDDDD